MKTLKLLYFVPFLVIYTPALFAQSAGITNGDSFTPDASSVLDVKSSNKGILIPRVSLVSSTDGVTIASPANSLMVYNTNEDITGQYGDGVGFYVNSGTTGSPSWRKLAAGGDVRWDDLRITLDKGSNSAALEYISGTSGPQIWYFRDNAGVESMSFTVQLPHTWVEGTIIYPHLHWLGASTASGNIVWNLEYTWVNYNPTTPQVFPAITTSTVTSGIAITQNAHNITALTASDVGIDGTGKLISSILICRLWRNSSNASDTYGADAGLLFVDFHILTDGFGSREVFVK